MDPGAAPSAGTRPAAGRLRWFLPAVLIAAEFLTLSLLVDLPTRGPALRLVEAARVAIPVILGAAVAGWLVARSSGTAPLQPSAPFALPPWRPVPALLAQLAVFGATTALALHLLAPTAPDPGELEVAVLLGSVGVTALLAMGVAVPLPWLVAEVFRRWRAPLLALVVGLLAWRAAKGAEQLWGCLSSFTLQAAGALVHLLAGEVTLDQAERAIGLRGFVAEVAPICSGAEGLGLVLTFQLTWIALARERLRVGRALWLLPLGAIAALLANVLRIAGLVLLGGAGYPDLALGGFHSKAGWALFVAIALASVALAEHVRWWRRDEAARPPPAGSARPDVAVVAPLVFVLAAALLTTLWVPRTLDRAYGVRIAAGALAIWAVRRSLPSLRPSRSAVAAALGLVVGVGWVAALHGDAGTLAAELSGLTVTERTLWIATRALGSVIVIPVVEELAFRGFLLEWLAGPRRSPRAPIPWAAVLVSSLAFGAVHASFVAGALAGAVFGLVRSWRDRIGDAVVAHALANAVISVAVLLLGRWDLWA